MIMDHDSSMSRCTTSTYMAPTGEENINKDGMRRHTDDYPSVPTTDKGLCYPRLLIKFTERGRSVLELEEPLNTTIEVRAWCFFATYSVVSRVRKYPDASVVNQSVWMSLCVCSSAGD